ncbi:hypothetical protein GWK47_055187 [Chionoecetes opilio]|uniref:Uncharacterized protein n=1 Tax=Chionoecetes opilio TaxID=41210 RepID=A0A8J4Y912_CHIOP|nr:hypothetical protein GWK47_055187 [Chionoecetes opilio]
MESSRTAEWFGWTFTTEEQVGETEKFFIVLPGVVLRHPEPPQEGQGVVLQLAGSVIGGEETLRGPPMFPPSLSARNPRRTIDHESFADSNVRTRGRAEAGFEDILEDPPREHDGGRPTKASFSEFLLNSNASTSPCQWSKPLVSKQKAMILSLTPASSTSFKTTAATFLPVESELAGTPRRNSASSSPVRRTAMRSSVSPERDGGEFSVPKAGPTSQVSPGSAVPRSSRGACSPFPPQICARWTVLFETAILQVLSKNLSGSCEPVDVACRTDNFPLDPKLK